MQMSIFQDREKYIGGSDVPVILEMSPYVTRELLLKQKAGLEKEDCSENKYTLYGEVMEDKIRDYINSLEPNYGFVEGKHIEEGDPIGYRCHTDGENEDTILEIKTTSNIEKSLDFYKVQICFYMMRTKKPNGLLACYLRPSDLDETFDKERLTVMNFTLEGFAEEGLTERISKGIELFIADLIKLKSQG